MHTGHGDTGGGGVRDGTWHENRAGVGTSPSLPEEPWRGVGLPVKGTPPCARRAEAGLARVEGLAGGVAKSCVSSMGLATDDALTPTSASMLARRGERVGEGRSGREKKPSWATRPPLLPPAVLALRRSSQASASRPLSSRPPSSSRSNGDKPRLEEERTSLGCRVERSWAGRDIMESQSSMSEVEERWEGAGEAPGDGGQARAGDSSALAS